MKEDKLWEELLLRQQVTSREGNAGKQVCYACLLVVPLRIERKSEVPETSVLSVVLRDQMLNPV